MKLEYKSDPTSNTQARTLRMNGDPVTLDKTPEKVFVVLGLALVAMSLFAVIGYFIAMGVTHALGLAIAGYIFAGGIGLFVGSVLPLAVLAAIRSRYS